MLPQLAVIDAAAMDEMNYVMPATGHRHRRTH